MFVVPPPPQINAAKAYPGITSLADTQNSIERSTGSENQLVLGEGTYAFRDQVRIAFPPPHPSDVPVVNTNPLAITQTPPTAGTKLSLVVIASRPKPIHNLYRLPSASDSRLHGHTESISEDKPYPSRPHNDGESVSESNGTGTPPNNSGASRFGLDNPALAAVPAEKTKDGSKKKKPKNNIVKSNSSFISRVIPHDSLHKRLNERSPYGILAFANVGRAVQWLDLAAENKVDNLTKLLFTKAHVLCHDINQVTKAPNNIEVLFGFNTSDIIWYEPTSQKYARINKNGIINNTAVSSINWLPGSDHLFVASHMDGSIIVYDKDKEDAAFVPEDAPAPSDGSKRPITAATMQIKKSVQSRNQRTNPVSYWQMGWDKINRIAFSPDGTHLAAVTENGRLKIIDIVREKLLDVFRSYYGALLSVTWSPDGRYILTGGQDDLVSIWSFADGMLVARCAGHSNFVTDVKFDPWRCDERSYRFGSVGEDCKLLLWDFSVGMLGRPRALSLRQRTTSIASGMAASDRRKESGATGSVLLSPRRTASRSNLGGASGGEDEEVPDDEDVGAEDHVVQHGVDSRASTASLPPVMAKVVGPQPLSWLGFEEDCIMAVSEDGYIRTWDRPSDAVPEE